MDQIQIDVEREPSPFKQTGPIDKITPNQRKFLLDLIERKQLEMTPVVEGKLDQIMKCLRISEDPEEFGMSKQAASELIEWFKGKPDKPNKPLSTNEPIPDGYYALRNVPGHKNDISFFRLKHGKGRWADMQFITQQAGPDHHTVRGKDNRRAIYDLVRQQGIEAARMLYAQELGRCYVCGLELTDDLSRQLGIGPVCRSK